MKVINNMLTISLLGLILFTASCSKDTCTTFVTYTDFVPVYMTLEEMNKEPEVLGAKPLKETGKIFVAGNYLLINELRQGVHVLDNTNPSNPLNIAFISVPGAMDMAVKNNLLYVDSYFDLVTIDLTSPSQPTILGRSKNAFEPSKYRFIQETGAYIVGYTEEEVTKEIACEDQESFEKSAFYSFDGVTVTPQFNGNASAHNIAGSMASMLLIDDYLYLINKSDILIFSSDVQPALIKKIAVNFGIETLFPYKDKLFIGSSNGMYIYDNSDPLNPQKLGQFSHANACDPVFVKDDIAYVTLRDGTFCNGFVNQLDVINVSNLMNPFLIKSYPMHHPKGLSVDDDKLYLCDGGDGVKVFGINDLESIGAHLEEHFPSIDAYDVIRMPDRELLLVIAKEGLYQFSIADGLDFVSRVGVGD